MILWLVALSGIGYCAILFHVWQNRIELAIESQSLGEIRKVDIFNHRTAQSTSPVIYSLDGNKHRNALLPATFGLVIAKVSGSPPPLIIAIYDQGKRDIDFRPATVTPAPWRRNVSGRAALFDTFLVSELRTDIERRFGKPQRRYLFGHSLAGYYALDLPTRQKMHGFAGIFAFSPTFSHDLSLINRLGATCANTRIVYASIGLESGRDADVFDRAAEVVKGERACVSRATFLHHWGIIHQFIMSTGHVAAFHRIFVNGK